MGWIKDVFRFHAGPSVFDIPEELVLFAQHIHFEDQHEDETENATRHEMIESSATGEEKHDYIQLYVEGMSSVQRLQGFSLCSGSIFFFF